VQSPGFTLHARHAPVQELMQQNPSMQKPEVHSQPSVHALPLFLSATQVLVLEHQAFALHWGGQTAGGTQAALHASLHPVLQAPLPLQV
jgi:hypothetical protein